MYKKITGSSIAGFFILAPLTASACGDDGNGVIQYALMFAIFTIYAGAMLLPLAGVIASLEYTKRSLSLVWGGSVLMTIGAFAIMYFTHRQIYEAIAVVLLAISVFLPTGYFLYRAIRK